MINYETFTLDNGLKVIVNHDKSTPLVAVNILYNAGAKNENENKTGLAHLFEHLMFGGSKNYPQYDAAVENMCGESNAFTNNDYTNYYLLVPSNCLEYALKIEADRMKNLTLTKKKLNVQKNVVIEEFKQRYLNQPYGDLWQKIRYLTYENHPYKWQTIGKDISHIEQITLEDVRAFYNKFYSTSNAILSISGNLNDKLEIYTLLNKIFLIPNNSVVQREKFHVEKWKKNKTETIIADVPVSLIVIAFQMCNRIDSEYYTYDLLSDIFSNGKSSRLYNSLVVEKQLFTEINACITGDEDEGLFIIMGKYQNNVSIEKGENAIWHELNLFIESNISDNELQKVKNKNESNLTFSNLKALDKAMNLAYFTHIGDTERINKEMDLYNAVTAQKIKDIAKKMFSKNNVCTLYYIAKNK
ncbi:MAG: insulinase family protein [Bacteroidales bacterium]|jgi:predicted Zn-dependent peptidase|nr:insulinase family protein [Bacteroidales bacterium]